MVSSTEEQLLLQALSGVAIVIFTKRDNSIRVMRCTNNLALIPERQHPVNTLPYNPNIYRVYDLDINQWRSFRKSTILKVQIGTQ